MIVEAITQSQRVDWAFNLFREAGLVNDQSRNIVGGFLAHCEIMGLEEGEIEAVEMNFIHQTESFSTFQPIKLVRNFDGTIQLLQDRPTLEYETSRRWEIKMDRVDRIDFSNYYRTRYIFFGERDGQRVTSCFLPYEGE